MNLEDARVELGELVHDNITDSLPVDPTKREIGAQVDIAIDAILAAGYRKPRTITTTAGLEALPAGTLLLSCSKYPRYAGTVWRVSSGRVVEKAGREAEGVTPFGYFKDPLPATVLYEPAVQ
jgi:hypothetical protein